MQALHQKTKPKLLSLHKTQEFPSKKNLSLQMHEVELAKFGQTQNVPIIQ